jgi:hypothetical protein
MVTSRFLQGGEDVKLRSVWFLIPWILGVRATGGTADAAEPEIRAVLNGLELVLDGSTGAIRKLSFPGPGTLLDADGGESGLVDVAYPVPEFEPLRLAARHGSRASIRKTEREVVISIPSLAPSRPGMPVKGRVSAVVAFRADPDGRSVITSCEIENRSERPVRQIVFPELRGLLPVAGPDHTILKSCGFGSAPFRELALPEADQWYAVNSSTVEHKAGGMFSSMWGRWLDLGGLGGGLSVFPRRWGWDPQTTTVAQLRQETGRLRLLWVHPDEVKPGESWKSGEWVITPHASGWAKGIEPYRAWVRSHVNRKYSMPRHVREGMGFRTVWMCQNQPADPSDVVWRFLDLPALARDARDHGLVEMVLWTWGPGFDASLPAPHPHLGTEDDLLDAVRECRELGVNVAPFISVLQASPRTAGRYGLAVSEGGGWTYHTELIPRWNPPYATGLSCVQVGPANRQWQDEVAEACSRWADKGLTSISWDQYFTTRDVPGMQDLTRRIRDRARSKDPESSFSGEELWNVEIDSEWLDYTWNWGGYRDCQAFVNAFPAPRPNVNINRSVAEARFAFMDGLFMNVWPSKPDGINGSEMICNVAALSGVLKECAALRKWFLPYFTDGVFIGDCLMPEVAPGVRLTAYVLDDRVLALALNQGAEGFLEFKYDLAPWVPGRSTFTVAECAGDPTGPDPGSLRAGALREVPAAGQIQTRRLKPLELAAFVFVAR